jgi:oligopeptidase B
MRSFRLIIPVLGVIMAASPLSAAAQPQPPMARQIEHKELRFGQEVGDPYFWLRDKGNPEVIKHLQAENDYTAARTGALKPLQDVLYQEMLGRIKQTDLSVPVRRGRFFYYTRTEEGRQYPIHCRRPAAADGSEDPKAPEQVLLDLNLLAKGLPFLGLGAFAVSDDDNLLAYTTDTTGYRQYQLHVKDLRTGALLPDSAERVDSVVWAADHRTLLFSTEDAQTKRPDQVWRLRLGAKAERVWEEKDELFTVGVGRTKDHRFLVMAMHSTDTWEARTLDAATPDGAFRALLGREKGHKYEIEHRDGLFYIRTNKDAKDFRVVTAPVADPSVQHWQPFIAARPGVKVERIDLFKGHAVVEERALGLNGFRVLDFASGKWHAVAFDETAYSAAGRENPEFNATLFRFGYQSMVTPPSTFDYDLGSRQRLLRKREEVIGYDPGRYVTERLWATAKDGVKVPLSVVYRKGLARDGKAPLWLYGYGSYGISMPASFDANRFSLLDRGMVWVTAHIRGGAELGEGWHEDGMLMKKMNTFTDFIASAEFLVSQKWTSKDRLVIEGGSAGGLLMGAVVNLRPDLFKAVHSAVPFVDVLNTMLDRTLPLTVGEYLEWGNPNEKPAYDYMASYSPYDNLAAKAYPAMLLTSSLNDSQVGYWEPAKYMARLRTLKTDGNELLLKMKLEPGGHGGASGRYDRLKDRAFEYAWMLGQVGIAK